MIQTKETLAVRSHILGAVTALTDNPIDLQETYRRLLLALVTCGKLDLETFSLKEAVATLDDRNYRLLELLKRQEEDAKAGAKLRGQLEASELLRSMEKEEAEERYHSLVHLTGLNAHAAENALKQYYGDMLKPDFDPTKQIRAFAELLRLIGIESMKVYNEYKKAKEGDNASKQEPSESVQAES